MIDISIDIGELKDLAKNLQSAINKGLNDAARDLSLMTYNHIVEEASKKLKSTRDKYIDALSYKQIDQDTWLINLDKKALWIEEGLPPGFDMLPGLLKGGTTARDGSVYRIIPFEHNNAPSQNSVAQNTLSSSIKAQLRKRNIPLGIEKDENGAPKLGVLHAFELKQKPIKTPLKMAEGPGQGHGSIGAPRQGRTGIHFLQGVRISQHEVEDKKTKGKSVKKSITTFRVASSKNPESFKHPGLEAKKFMDDALTWAEEQWKNNIENQVVANIISNF